VIHQDIFIYLNPNKIVFLNKILKKVFRIFESFTDNLIGISLTYHHHKTTIIFFVESSGYEQY